MPKKPKIVVLCGSSKFVDLMAVCAWIIERDEQAITMGLHLLPHWYCNVPDHLAEHEGVAEQMDDLHLRKIDLADEIFVVNHHDYIGKSTACEINYAVGKDVKIRWLTHDPVGSNVYGIINKQIDYCIFCGAGIKEDHAPFCSVVNGVYSFDFEKK